VQTQAYDKNIKGKVQFHSIHYEFNIYF